MPSNTVIDSAVIATTSFKAIERKTRMPHPPERRGNEARSLAYPPIALKFP
jgi:hypothetical protein